MTPTSPSVRTVEPADDGSPDDVVVARVLAGKSSDFAVLMRRYNQRMFRAVRGVMKQDAEAEDVVQQAWLSAYRALAGFHGQASLATWLTRIAVNEALGRVRTRTRRGDLFVVEAGDDMAGHGPSPEDEAVSHETIQLLETHIDALPEAYRLVFIMRDVEELTTAETAAVLEISEGAVRVRLHRARQLLQAAVTGSMHLAAAGAFHFDGARCDRIVAAVLGQLDAVPRA